MRKVSAIERDLFWQKHVRDNALNKAQRERAEKAIAKFEAELQAAKAAAANDRKATA